MKKRIISMICLLAASAVMMTATGCGTNEDDTSSTENAAEAVVTLGEYKGMELEYEKTSVTDEDVDEAILSEVNSSAEQVEITDRAVKDGDTVNIDYVGKVDGEAFDGGTAEAQDLVIGSGSFIDDFEEQLIGANIGDTLDVEVTFPENYSSADLAGKDAVFTVTINSIKAYPEVELTDALISEHTEGAYTTLEDYRSYKLAELEATAESNNTSAQQNAIITELMEICTVENPTESKVKAYMDNYYSQYEYYAEMYGLEFADFVEQYMQTTEEELESQIRTSCEYNVSVILILEKIADQEGIEITDEEYSSYIEEQAATQSMDASTFESTYSDFIRDTMIQEKVLEYLIGVTTFTEA